MTDRNADTDRAPEEAARFWERVYADRAEPVWSGRPNPLLAETARAIAPGTALDLGSGEGGDAVWLASRGWTVTAVDIAPTALARTTARAVAAGTAVAQRLTVEQHDLARTFPAGTFDLINAQYLQTPFDLPRARVFQRAARALAAGGLLLVVDHGSVRPWSWDPDPDTRFPAPEEIYDALDLDPAVWRPERLDRPRREATGPGGQTAMVTDTVVAIRRLTG
ncbi:methyltransferase domain-containing protein [Streptomyces mobaraensis NBRC 13819 = DSM 40847]|uniref:Type 12 methyltransferase n=1 Tax=Streptomyces mobaraensis (strain ATCC 29032 / DSM 40847 / JCM 4168 / NBRC 13819 / NCIMB 11159 / IPCR 16-22) TaxID=1223523 RepID=M3AYI6_STRM1|nr:class I SAM-dependent methyltransferase [Streptomyces mobaraensis]EME98732.1 type 12 methyltransferase [Streptomyces mobaraensis NBRC 13819 = DSM 40847]QTT77398.1 methyltransferase domain-containing protein [Streptomyces mobaraensis NBRC 13819 = DSM 40847]